MGLTEFSLFTSLLQVYNFDDILGIHSHIHYICGNMMLQVGKAHALLAKFANLFSKWFLIMMYFFGECDP